MSQIRTTILAAALMAGVSIRASAQYDKKLETFGSIGIVHYSNYAFWEAARRPESSMESFRLEALMQTP